MNNLPLRSDHVELLRGMLVDRANDLPQRLPPEHRIKLESSEEFIRIDNRIQEIGVRLAEESDQKDLQAERDGLYNRKHSLKRMALENLQRNWNAINYDQEVQRQLLHGNAIGLDPQPVSRFSILRQFLPERHRLANSLFSPQPVRSSHGKVLSDLASLCRKSESVSYRPGELPVQGRCSFNKCHKLLTE
ncbi:MAG: hypothetical protein MMC23_004807 [Stictis urceolatum]|nr:hypothetical protein [Stictis urceolata]